MLPWYPEVKRAVDVTAITRITLCGKVTGILIVDDVQARELLELEPLFVAASIDLALLRAAVRRTAKLSSILRPLTSSSAY